MPQEDMQFVDTDGKDGVSKYEEYEAEFNRRATDRQAHRRRRVRVATVRRSRREVVSELADPVGLEAGFSTTYQPSRFEQRWLLSSLRTFYEEGLITDVLALIKGGKEASVYRCRADPATSVPFLAAKVYRPRAVRNLRNDKLYRQGRETLTDGGRVVKRSDHRIMRAIDKKTTFGLQVRHTSWLMYEFTTLQKLEAIGAAVPRVYSSSGNAILMDYIGDARRPAPTLQEVHLEQEESRRLFVEVMRNVDLMLSLDLVHGDLSAYNVLYWEGAVRLIDFPQVIDLCVNRQAERILARDITRTCEYFQRRGVACDPARIHARLWERYGVDHDPELEALPQEQFTE